MHPSWFLAIRTKTAAACCRSLSSYTKIYFNDILEHQFYYAQLFYRLFFSSTSTGSENTRTDRALNEAFSQKNDSFTALFYLLIAVFKPKIRNLVTWINSSKLSYGATAHNIQGQTLNRHKRDVWERKGYVAISSCVASSKWSFLKGYKESSIFKNKFNFRPFI